MFNFLTRVVNHLYYDLVLSPRGYGKPVPKSIWDSQYKNGFWDFVRSLDEMAHYMIIVGYVHYFHKHPAILELGCGHGHLAELLSKFGFRNYLGIDLSSEAVKEADMAPLSNTRFEVADFEECQISQSFDGVILTNPFITPRGPWMCCCAFRGAWIAMAVWWYRCAGTDTMK